MPKRPAASAAPASAGWIAIYEYHVDDYKRPETTVEILGLYATRRAAYLANVGRIIDDIGDDAGKFKKFVKRDDFDMDEFDEMVEEVRVISSRKQGDLTLQKDPRRARVYHEGRRSPSHRARGRHHGGGGHGQERDEEVEEGLNLLLGIHPLSPLGKRLLAPQLVLSQCRRSPGMRRVRLGPSLTHFLLHRDRLDSEVDVDHSLFALGRLPLEVSEHVHFCVYPPRDTGSDGTVRSRVARAVNTNQMGGGPSHTYTDGSAREFIKINNCNIRFAGYDRHGNPAIVAKNGKEAVWLPQDYDDCNETDPIRVVCEECKGRKWDLVRTSPTCLLAVNDLVPGFWDAHTVKINSVPGLEKFDVDYFADRNGAETVLQWMRDSAV